MEKRVSIAETEIKDLKSWQERQNGALIRLADSYDRLNTRLALANENTQKQFTSHYRWLAGIFVVVIANLVVSLLCQAL